MAHLIDKDALVAWAKETYLCENASMIRKVCYKQLLEHLDTLEVKGVDLEKELKYYCNKYYNCDYPKQLEEGTCSKVMPHIVSAAKHFFELGLKVQKGE